MYRNCRAGAAAHYGGGFANFKDVARFANGFMRPKYNVPTNIIRNETNFEIHIYALGFEKANMNIQVTGDTLSVSGTREISENYQPEFVRQEFPIKTFERIFQLSDVIDTENISAKQENNVLILTLPIKPEAQATSHSIEVE